MDRSETDNSVGLCISEFAVAFQNMAIACVYGKDVRHIYPFGHLLVQLLAAFVSC